MFHIPAHKNTEHPAAQAAHEPSLACGFPFTGKAMARARALISAAGLDRADTAKLAEDIARIAAELGCDEHEAALELLLRVNGVAGIADHVAHLKRAA